MIQVVLIILVYIIGPIAILAWAFNHHKRGVKPSFGEISVVTLAIALMILFATSSIWNISDRDSSEADQVVAELIQRYDFPVKAKFEDRPAVDGIARPRRLEIHIYGVIERDEQEKVVEVLKKLRRQMASKPVVIHFNREEIWEETSDGSRQPRRDREELVRKVRID